MRPEPTRPAADGPADRTTQIFDDPSRWRVLAARALGLRGLELAAAVSPGAGFPATMRPLVRHVDEHRCRRVVDAGAGLGGTAEWLRALTGADVVAVEPAAGAAEGARTLFGGVHVVRGDVAAMPLATGTADAVVCVGVLSLVQQLEPALAELARVARPHGLVAVSDLVLDADGGERRTGPNRFRSVDALVAAAADVRLRCVDVGIGTVDTSGPWRDLADAVDREVGRRHAGDAAFPAWRDDQDHLARELSSGRLLAATLTFERAAAPPPQAGRSSRRSAATAMRP